MIEEKAGQWRHQLAAAVNSAGGEIVGWKNIEHYWHGRFVTQAILAFGESRESYFYIEGLPPRGNIPRPDLVLIHPRLGVLVLEVKGIGPADLVGVQGGALLINRKGVVQTEDPILQAERVMFRLRDLCKEHLDIRWIHFGRLAALPAITRQEFTSRLQTQPSADMLFAADCADSGVLREHITRMVNAVATALPADRINREARDAVINALNGRSFFRVPRRAGVVRNQPATLGAQIQEMELAVKEPTDQQKSLGRADLRGAHRLFRGVAGSGKSVLLALNAAQTLLTMLTEQGDLFAPTGRIPRIAVLCFNRTLTHYLRRKITERFMRIAWAEPPTGRLLVAHFEELVRLLEHSDPNLETGLGFDRKELRASRLCTAIDALGPAAREALSYDVVYVDETQDLLPAELEIVRRICRPNAQGRQTLILFYDNAQNIYGVAPPVWDKIGINIVGRTVFLDQCLRNTRQIVEFAFNVLVGTHARADTPVATRQFADVSNLLGRGLVRQNDGKFEINFCRRSGPSPSVRQFETRALEIQYVSQTIGQLVHEQNVLPSDILLLYKSHHLFDGLEAAVNQSLGTAGKVHLVDSAHPANKRRQLMEEGSLTISTIASAKGYDAPVVFVLGVDDLLPDPRGRAAFYVACTRAKFTLTVTGVRRMESTLLDETAAAVRATAGCHAPAAGTSDTCGDSARCGHCGSDRLHAQTGRSGFEFRCVDCTGATPLSDNCPRCGEKATLRAEHYNFFLDCTCGHSALLHTNIPLECWE